MPNRRSKRLRGLVVEIKTADRGMPGKAFFAKAQADYPHLTRAPIFCWLWDNFEQVSELRNWQGMGIARIGWDELAVLIAEDGILGTRGQPPNGNSVRRVWPRVVADKARRDEREGAGKAAQK